MLALSWISGPEQHLLWSEVVLGTVLVEFTVLRDWIDRLAEGAVGKKGNRHETVAAIARSAIVVALVMVLAGMSGFSWLLAGWTAGVTGSFSLAAKRFERQRLEAEAQLLLAALIVGGTGWIIGAGNLSPVHTLFSLPLSPSRVTALCLGAAIILFSGRGGTAIVRGVLAKAGAFPQVETATGETAVDTAEYGRGRLIGDLERLLIVVTISLNAYAAMGFLIAAKGLIRIREFEKRDFAEYFLIGTLTSVVVALLLGLILRVTMVQLW